MREEIRSLLIRGVAAAKAGDADEARRYLEWALMRNPPTDQRIEAWYWLSEISTDPVEQRKHMENILATSPGDARARRKMAMLDGKLQVGEVIDPDRMQAPAPGSPSAANARRFTCPSCGGRMSFTPDGQSLTCEFCDSQNLLSTSQSNAGEIVEDDFVVSLATARGHGKPVRVHSLTCHGCGADFILPPDRLSSLCPYCDTPYALEQVKEREVIEPAAVIPFMISGEQAGNVLKKWFREQRIKPLPELTPLQGIYLPAWTFDIEGNIPWHCQIYQYKNWESKNSIHPVSIDDLTLLATDRLPERLRPVVRSYDRQQLVPYDTRYIAAWTAETYRISMSDASLEARSLALADVRRNVQSSFLRPMKDLTLDSSQMYITSSKLILLPVWLTHYSIEGKRYDLVINGQSGEVFGESQKRGLRGFIKEILE